MNKLAANAKKALGKAPPAKSKVAPAPPIETSSIKPYVQPKIAGLPPDRYHEAHSALDTLSRAQEHQANAKLMADVQRVAEHKMKALSSVVGGGKKGKK